MGNHQVSASPPDAWALKLPRTFRALRHRNFRLYWFGQAFSLTGTWMQTVAQGWLVYSLTNSPFALGLVGFAASLPILLFSLFGGVVADRFPKRDLLLMTQMAAMLQALILATLTVTGLIQVWQIVVLALLLGTVHAFDTPARQAFVIELVGKEDLMNAIALNSSVFNATRIIGPAMAGVLIAVIGEAGAFYINAASFLATIAGLLLMRLKPVNHSNSETVWKNLVEGLRYIKQTPMVRTLLSVIGVSSLFGMSSIALLPVFARDILQVGPTGLGFLTAAIGAGALTGALSLASLGTFPRKGLLLSIGNLLFPAMLIGLALSRSFGLSLLFLMGGGWGLITQNALTNTLLQTSVPDHLRGRVMSVYALMFLGLMPIGNLQAGVLAEQLGAPFAVMLGAGIAGGYALWIFLRRPEVRRSS